MNRSIRTLDRELHQVLYISTVCLVTKCFFENFDGRLRCDFTRFSSTDAISHSEDRAFGIVQKSIFVQGTTLVQPTVRQGSGLDLQGFGLFAHCTASSLRGEELLATGLSRMTRSRAFRFENAISIPSIAKLVIRLKPPWLTNGSVIPVIGKALKIPPMFTNA